MRYVFRLSAEMKQKLDIAVPPKSYKRSSFVRAAIDEFLKTGAGAVRLADRPHLRGRENAYEEVCAMLPAEQIDALKTQYPNVSVSIAIQAAVQAALASDPQPDIAPKTKRQRGTSTSAKA